MHLQAVHPVSSALSTAPAGHSNTVSSSHSFRHILPVLQFYHFQGNHMFLQTDLLRLHSLSRLQLLLLFFLHSSPLHSMELNPLTLLEDFSLLLTDWLLSFWNMQFRNHFHQSYACLQSSQSCSLFHLLNIR